MKKILFFFLPALLLTGIYSCQDSTELITETEEPETIQVDMRLESFNETFMNLAVDVVSTKKDKRSEEFDPIIYLEEASIQYGEDLVTEYLETPEYHDLGTYENLIDYINDEIISPELQSTLHALFQEIDDAKIEQIDNSIEGLSDEDAITVVSQELIGLINNWYDANVHALNPEEQEDLTTAKIYAESIIPVLLSTELHDLSGYRGGGRFKRWFKKNVKKVVSTVKGIVTGAVKGVKKAAAANTSKFWGGVIGGVVGGGKSFWRAYAWNVCWFIECEQCCNSEIEEDPNFECANLFENCEGATAPFPWEEEFECNGQTFSFDSFKQYCKHFK